MKASTALALVLLTAGGLHAPLQAQQQQGDREVQFSGSLLSTIGREDISTTAAIVQTKLGYFFTDHVEVGVFPSLLFTRTRVETPLGEEVSDDTRFGMGLFGTYSFLAEDATTVPYVGGQFYRIDVTDDDETGWVGATGGFKFYMSPSMAFDAGGNVLMGLGDSGGTLVLFQVGLSFLL